MSALQTVQRFFPKVKTVTDATRIATIEVTKADASATGVKNHNECAMAVACKRKFHLDGVIISRSTAYLVKGTKARRFQIPPSVSREVVSFDRGGGFAPGCYTLSAVSPLNRLGSRQGSSKDSKVKKQGGSKFRHLTTNIRTVLGGIAPEGD